MFLELADATLMVSSFGAGPRTIVAHGGWVGSGELWLPPFESMSRTWRTVTFDHRGTGASQSRANSITFEHLVADLFAVLDRLGVERCVLAGESAGAAVVMTAALRQPRRFDGLVLVSPHYDGTPTAQMMQFMKGCQVDFATTMEAFVEACVPEPECAAERAWGRKIVNRSNAKDAVELLACMRDVRVMSRLSELTVPTLILHGDRDVIRSLAASEELARRMPRAKLAVASGAGHVPTVTRPDWVARQIEAHFATG